MTQSLFLCAIEANTMILCEHHAKAFELAALTAATPHTIVELDEKDIDGHHCHACELQAAKAYVKQVEDEMTRPRIILPGEVF